VTCPRCPGPGKLWKKYSPKWVYSTLHHIFRPLAASRNGQSHWSHRSFPDILRGLSIFLDTRWYEILSVIIVYHISHADQGGLNARDIASMAMQSDLGFKVKTVTTFVSRGQWYLSMSHSWNRKGTPHRGLRMIDSPPAIDGSSGSLLQTELPGRSLTLIVFRVRKRNS